MQQLTAKQIANRKYYAEHAEAIRQQKRESYEKTKEDRPVKKRKPKPVTIIVEKQPVRHTVKAEDRKKLQARRKIEDIMMARELGIDDEFDRLEL